MGRPILFSRGARHELTRLQARDTLVIALQCRNGAAPAQHFERDGALDVLSPSDNFRFSSPETDGILKHPPELPGELRRIATTASTPKIPSERNPLIVV